MRALGALLYLALYAAAVPLAQCWFRRHRRVLAPRDGQALRGTRLRRVVRSVPYREPDNSQLQRPGTPKLSAERSEPCVEPGSGALLVPEAPTLHPGPSVSATNRGGSTGVDQPSSEDGTAVPARVLESADHCSEATKTGLDPIKRGGKPRGTPQSAPAPSGRSHVRHQRPEVICYKRERVWTLGLEVVDRQQLAHEPSVYQNKKALKHDEYREATWLLKEPGGFVEISRSDHADPLDQVNLGEAAWSLFKLSANEEGRRVTSASKGEYLLLAPEDWTRDEPLAGSPHIAPEPTSIPGYVAHFFLVEKGCDPRIALRASSGGVVCPEMREPLFELIGTRLFDAADHIGPLFGGAQPLVRILGGRGWSCVGKIIVGAEGAGRGRWKEAVELPSNDRDQDVELPHEITAHGAGWYFIRFYDPNDRLIDSLDFRVACMFDAVDLIQPAPLPMPRGHEPVRVTFRHRSGAVIEPVCTAARQVQITRGDIESLLELPARADCDRTCWQIGAEGRACVNLTLLVERVWWAVSREDSEPSEWNDREIDAVLSDFAAISDRTLWIRLPRPRWTDAVGVGFAGQTLRSYEVRVSEAVVRIPLREFGDSQELQTLGQDIPLHVWIRRAGPALPRSIRAILIKMPLPPRVPSIAIPTPPRLSNPFCIEQFIQQGVIQRGRLKDLVNELTALSRTATGLKRTVMQKLLLKLRMRESTCDNVWRAFVAIDLYQTSRKPVWWDQLVFPEAVKPDFFEAARWLKAACGGEDEL